MITVTDVDNIEDEVDQDKDEIEKQKLKLTDARPELRITPHHRAKLKFYLDNFYKHFPNEKYTIFHFVRFFKKRLKDNKDAWMGVCGDTGSGKSRFVLMAMILMGRPVGLEKNVCYIPKGNEIMDKFDKLKMQCLLIDEAAREMRAVNWQSKQQQGVNEKAMTDRFKNNWVFLNMPSFNEFTKSMRRSNLIFRAILPFRTAQYARVIVQRKGRNWRSDDPWNDETANKAYQKYDTRKEEITNDKIVEIERSLPSTALDFIVPDLGLILPDVVEEYEYRKLESRKLGDMEATKDKWKTKFEDTMEKVVKSVYYNTIGFGIKKVSKKDMAKALGVTIGTFDKYLSKVVVKEEATKEANFRDVLKKRRADTTPIDVG